MLEFFIFLAALVWVLAWSAAGYFLGQERDRAAAGFLLSFLLGPLGCAIILLFPVVDRRPARRPAGYRPINYQRHKRHIPGMLLCPYCAAKCHGSGVVQCPQCREHFDTGI